MSSNVAARVKTWAPIIVACFLVAGVCGIYLMSSMGSRPEPDIGAVQTNIAEMQKKLAALNDLPSLPPMLDTVALVQSTAKACGLGIETRPAPLNIEGRPVGYNGPVPAWRLLLKAPATPHLISCAYLLTAETDLMIEAFGIRENRSELYITIFGSLGPIEDRSS